VQRGVKIGKLEGLSTRKKKWSGEGNNDTSGMSLELRGGERREGKPGCKGKFVFKRTPGGKKHLLGTKKRDKGAEWSEKKERKTETDGHGIVQGS